MALSGFDPREHTKNNTNMKKTYIKPENVVVAINAKEKLMQQSITDVSNAEGLNGNGGNTSDITGPVDPNSREVIRSRGAWEEW